MHSVYFFTSVFSSVRRSPASHSSPPNQDRAGPSDFQSFSESLKSRLNSMSMKYNIRHEFSFFGNPYHMGKFNILCSSAHLPLTLVVLVPQIQRVVFKEYKRVEGEAFLS